MSFAETDARFDIEDCLTRIGRGEEAALRRLYEVEAPRMLGVAMRILRRRALAEEAVHDAFLRIWKSAATYNAASGSGRGWIYTIVRNRALNILRGEARTDLTDDVEAFGQASEDETPEEVMSRLSDADALRRCLERLDARRRGVILLAYTQGLSHGELAARMNVPLGTMKSWIRRGLMALKECLA